MTMATAKTQCSLCDEEKDTYICTGCSKTFCFNHLQDHRETINKHFNKIEDNFNLFRQIILHEEDDLGSRSSMEDIDKWEKQSIEKIKQTADQCRQRVIKYKNKFIIEIKNKLNNLTEQLEQIRKKNKLNEIDLNQLNQQLNKLKEEINKLSNVSIKQQSTSFINKIFVITPFNQDTKWKQVGLTIAGGNSQGNNLNQLSFPHGIVVDDNYTVYIADWGNHRIIESKYNATNGQIVAGGNGEGNKMNQLHYPTNVIIDKENDSFIISDMQNKRVMRWPRQNNQNGQIIVSDIDCSGLTMDKNGSLYISDCFKNEVRQWKKGDKNGIIVAGGNGKGDHFNQLNFPTFIFVDEDYSLYISDRDNHRVMKWEKDAKEGIIVAGGNGQGNDLRQLSSPCGVIVDHLGQIYVVDFGNHRVMRWCPGAKEGTIVVGGNGKGKGSNQFYNPTGLSFDREGNLYVVDSWNHRLQKFEIN